jgi:hypothetical protein
MKKISVTVFIGLCMLSFAIPNALAGDAETAAQKAALQWLSLVDAEKFDHSWESAAALFKKAITKDQWHQTIKAVRPPMGKLASRKLIDATYTTALPGAPDGEYVVIRFQSSFSNKNSAIETVTPMKDSDGIWRVSGYFIN